MPRWRITLSHQVLALVAISILAAQITGLIVLFSLPPRPAGGVAMSQVYERTQELLKQIADQPGGDLLRLATAPTSVAPPFPQRRRPMAAKQPALPLERVQAVEFEASPLQRFLRRAQPM